MTPRPGVQRSGARRWRAVLVAPLLPAVLVACATRVTMPALPESHPAHHAAAAAEPIRPSDLLERAAPVPAVEPAVLDPHDHHAHGLAESAPPGQPAAGPGAEEHEHDPDAAEHEGHEQPPREHEVHEHDAGHDATNGPEADQHQSHEHRAHEHQPDPPEADQHEMRDHRTGDPDAEEHEHHHDPDAPPPEPPG